MNGSVDLGDNAQAHALHTVNGDITLARGSHVANGIKSVNGDISLNPSADVGGGVSNVNGTIRLDHAHVAGGIETTDGNITIGEGSRVEGGILVNEVNAHAHGWRWNDSKPHIVIGPHAIVQGSLEFRREVVLQVSDSAQIGPVKGATPVTFHGSTP